MNRAQKYVASLPVGTREIEILERDWGCERVYRSPDGKDHCIPESLLFSSDYEEAV